MKLGFTRNLQIGYGLSILLLLIVGVFSWFVIQNLLLSNRWVERSNRIIGKLEETLSAMKDAETGQRGYLLTGQPDFLEPYNGSYKRAIGLADTVVFLTRDNSIQRQNAIDVKQVLMRRLNILDVLISKKQHGEIITVDELRTGKAAMDALRSSVNKAENQERKLLAQRVLTLRHYALITPWVIITAIVVAIIIALLSYARILRDINEKDKLRHELEIKEAETARANVELAAANEELGAANEELAAANDSLAAMNEEYYATNEELSQSRSELETLNNELEEIVSSRTKALTDSEAEAQALNEELNATNEDLAAANERMLAANEELTESRQNLQKTVDELVLAKDQVERSERLFRSIAVNIPKSLIIIIGPDHRFLAVEGELMVKMGYNGSDYVGKHPAEVSPPERYEATKHLYDRVLTGEHFSIERKGTTGDDYRVDFVPLKNESGEVYAGLIIALDITEIKRAEERSAKLAAIVETSGDAIVGKTLEGIITSWNKSAERMFGYTEAEIIGESILKLIPEDRTQEENHILSRMRLGERVEHFETIRVTKEGRLIDVSLTISPIKDSHGNIIGVSKIARDISEKKRDEIRKNDFIGMVSHELKTPLTSLTALIQVANTKLKNSEDAFLSGALSKANVQVKKMSAMINGFLNISRFESGKMLVEKQAFDLTALIGEIIGEVQFVAPSFDIEFTAGNSMMVNADRDKIGSVISNLLNNAVKYSPVSKLIEVKCERAGNKIQTSVKDQGIGIKQQDQERLFDRYYRVEGNDTQHISGFGIGLYLSAEIVRHHDGEIWVESAGSDGSTFYFTLPALV